MELAEALTLPAKTNIPSITLHVHNMHGVHVVSDNKSVTIYNVSDPLGRDYSQLRVFHKTSKHSSLEHDCPYLVQSSVTSDGLRGVYLNKYKQFTSIQCDEFAIFKPKKNMEQVTTVNNTTVNNTTEGPPYDLTQLQSYFGKAYVDTRQKMSMVDGVNPQQAHEAALAFLEFIPKAWFGEKLLP